MSEKMNGWQFEGWYKTAEALVVILIILGAVEVFTQSSELLELANTGLQFVLGSMEEVGTGIERLLDAYERAPSYDLFENLLRGTVDTTTAPSMLNKTNPDVINGIQEHIPLEYIDQLDALGK